MPNMCISSYM